MAVMYKQLVEARHLLFDDLDTLFSTVSAAAPG
jgi:hypothetical protein